MSVALILGAGNNVGKALATKFVANGVKVAVGSRSGSVDDVPGILKVKVDVTQPSEVSAAFAKAESELGAPVNIVVYNVGQYTALPTPDEPFSVPYDRFLEDVKAGALGAYVALQEAVAAFKKVPSNVPKVFIATSNLLGVDAPSIGMFSLGVEKRNLAYYIQAGHDSKAYTQGGFRFYLASQVSAEGAFPGKSFDAEAHATAYWNLIQRKAEERGGWDIRFIQDGSILVEN